MRMLNGASLSALNQKLVSKVKPSQERHNTSTTRMPIKSHPKISKTIKNQPIPMTGKFTQHVHNLGYLLGRSLHATIRWTIDLYQDGNDDVRPVDDPIANATKLGSWISKHVVCTVSSQSCTAPPTATTAASSSAPTTMADALHTLATTLTIKRGGSTSSIRTLHVLIETLLIVFCIALVILQRRADWRLDSERKNQKLSEGEVEELLVEWKSGRMKLGGGGRHTDRDEHAADSGNGLIVDRVEGSKLFLHPASTVSHASDDPSPPDRDNATALPPSVINFATHDYLSASSSPLLQSTAHSSLQTYGCGSCGPAASTGPSTPISNWNRAWRASCGPRPPFSIRTERAPPPPPWRHSPSGAICSWWTRGRANVRYFRHNDVNDLRRVLEKVRGQDGALRRRPTDQRRFLVVEGLYKNWGTVCPLEEVVALKEEFCFRLILDDSHAIGTMGETGRGSLERCGLLPMVHCEILTFSIENALGSVGGMTVGSEEVVDHQRLSGAGYCFSASAPPFLSKVCVASLKRLQGNLDEVPNEQRQNGNALQTDNPESCEELSGPLLLEKLHENISNLYSTLTNSSHPHALKLRNRLVITSHLQSPIIYLRLSDQQATGLTRAKQISLLDRIASHCLVKGGVAVVSTGGHVRKYLQLVPEPCLRVIANVSQTMEDVESLAKALGEAVEEVLCRNAFGLEIIKED
ncbi:hypothetical protein HJC23_001118 [Cyclotella cryptica]|uniref:serine C-palmitoyltransferase n=1 Tax=Cyclotella cryptica TaxID=29204 RepID=A0ABD3QJG2_9STRA